MEIPRNPSNEPPEDKIIPLHNKVPPLDLTGSEVGGDALNNLPPLNPADYVPEGSGTPNPDAVEEMKKKYEERYDAMFGSAADAATKVKAHLSATILDVAENLTHIALHSPNERVRADVAKFLLDRMVFKASASDDEMAEWMQKLAATQNKANG